MIKWFAMIRDRKYLPDELEGGTKEIVSKLYRAVYDSSKYDEFDILIEEMTDQVDVLVYSGNKWRKVAVYMVGE
jgi:hypothetical protein